MYQIYFTDQRTFTPSKIVCVGRNYAKHIEEMKSERTSDPVLFLKPNSALWDITQPIPLPKGYGSVHHEIELAVCIDAIAGQIDASQAGQFILGYGLALDLTLRDMQSSAKKAGLPWAVAKGFNHACPVSAFIPAGEIDPTADLQLTLSVNGQVRQKGNTSHMLFKISELIAYASRFFRFESGDLLLTGTPAGVGPLQAGDTIEAAIHTIANITTRCI